MEMAKHIVDWDLNQTFNGMILPKFNVFNLKNWMNVLPANLQYMPTLETKEIFDVAHNIELYQALKYDFHKTLCLRIGGNDLLSCLNLRRPKKYHDLSNSSRHSNFTIGRIIYSKWFSVEFTCLRTFLKIHSY